MAYSYKRLTPLQYIADITEKIPRAQRRISFVALELEQDDITRPVIDALCDAAKRGVQVSMAADSFTYIEPSKKSFLKTGRDQKIKQSRLLQKKLSSSGVTFSWLGKFSALLFSGRTHSKWLVIDDDVYSFGGVNMKAKSTGYVDYMFHVKNADLANKLHAEQDRILHAEKTNSRYRSHRFGDDDNMVLIDGGILADSIIYRRANYWAQRAKHVLFVSQYCPTGKLSRNLKKADSDLYFNHWSTAGLINKFIILLGMKLSQHTTSYNRRRYLHAKFIVFTLDDGSKVAITGSHNYTSSGVLFGTREIALETTDKSIIKQLETFYKQSVR